MMTHWLTHQIDVHDPAHPALEQEWLLANGQGGFAMGSLPAINGRRYHGLLVAATRPPVGRIMLLSQMLEQVRLSPDDGQQEATFSSLAFTGRDGQRVYSPTGHRWLRRVDRGLHMSWHYQHPAIEFTRSLHVHWKQQAITLRYRVAAVDPAATPTARLHLAPMLAMRDFHELTARGVGDEMRPETLGDGLVVRRGGLACAMRCRGARFRPHPDWWFGIHYSHETERGQSDYEDLFVPGAFELELDLSQPTVVELTAALGEQPAPPIDPDDTPRAEHLARIPLASKLNDLPTVEAAHGRRLVLAGDDFVVDRIMRGQTLQTILAGYPWFSDWGRDTFIAMPGLLLATGRFDEARDVLRAFADSVRRGLVPNCFDDRQAEAAHYNTVDASLWFVHAALEYLKATDDREAWVDWLGGAVREIVDAYRQGTDFGIRAGDDGLIRAGSPQTQLTWMDAAAVDPEEGRRVVFTPRHGRAVEIGALWYRALCGLVELPGSLLGDQARRREITQLRDKVRESFVQTFWDADRGYLADHVYIDNQGQPRADLSLRPNQVLAVSLPFSPLPEEAQRRVVAVVGAKLLTPFGLRTLPEDDRRYHPDYTGPAFERDQAYHQGTVWPWLIGPYAEAVMRVGRFDEASRAEARRIIEPLLEQMAGCGHRPTLGQLHEIHEAKAPHRPVGAIAQAWSVAEVLRIWRMTRDGARYWG